MSLDGIDARFGISNGHSMFSEVKLNSPDDEKGSMDEQTGGNEHPQPGLKGAQGLSYDQSCGYPQDCFIDPVPNLICAICTEIVRKPCNLPCPHLFCQQCLRRAVKTKNVCPTCRVKYNPKVLDSINTHVSHSVYALPIKCVNWRMGCDWKGVIGTNEQTIENHLRSQCKYGGFIKCPDCDDMIRSTNLEEHAQTCLSKIISCEFCAYKASRYDVLIHKYIGVYQGHKCQNSYICPMLKCKKLIVDAEELGQLTRIRLHLLTECEHYPLICYGCPTNHSMPAKNLRLHVTAHEHNIEWHKQWIKNTLFSPPNHPGLYYVPRPTTYTGRYGNLICEIERKNNILTTPIEGISYSPVDTSLMIKSQKVSPKALDALLHHECSYSITGSNTYLSQPFFTCQTCTSNRGHPHGTVGCCAICAITCHYGHVVVLDPGMDTSFCDCGDNNLGPKCCAPKPIKIPALAESENEVSVNFHLRGDSSIDLNVRSSHSIKPQQEDPMDFHDDIELE